MTGDGIRYCTSREDHEPHTYELVSPYTGGSRGIMCRCEGKPRVATPPVSAAPVVPPKPSLADLVYTEAPEHESYQSAYAWSPVVPAATDEPALDHWRCAECDMPQPFALGVCADCFTVRGAPAATDEPALAVIAAGLAFEDGYANWHTALQAPYREAARRVVAALEANGYVVLRRELLDRLLDDADDAATTGHRHNLEALAVTVAAVVEAVGPTREDTKA